MSTTATDEPAAFDVCGPLPTGTTVLEASAGTGKTFTIAALAARYLAEGRAELSELMLVTFGREATNELRERVRERLVSAERGLADPAAARSGPDEVLALLAGAGDAEVALRRARLTRALAQFDAATIATTHQFCQRMLAGLGVAADADPDARFVESVDDLLTEVVDDFYVRKYADHGTGSPAFSRAEALTIARRAVHDRQARLEPADADAGSTADVRRRFAAAVRAEVDRRKQARRLYTYDDMLTRLDAALADPERGAAQRLRDRYRVVLVDEFQDTDPVQWSILRRAFHGAVTLVLIGDPKQAIYAFRGADVISYLDATEAAGRHATLARNWRSDPALLSALNTVFGGAALGDPRITVHPVRAAHRGRRLRGGPADSPLRLRVVPRGTLPRSQRDLTVVGPTRELVAHDLAGDVAALLAGPALIQERPVRPGDVAVLVRTNDQGTLVRDALAAAGVPAVLSGTVSVFATPVAEEWLTLLEACAQPRLPRLRAAALTCFVGHSVADLCGPGGTELLDELGGTVREWAAVLAERGVAALLEAVTTGTALPRRLLARHRRRAHPDRPAARRPGPARGRLGRAPRPGRAARLAAAPDRRGGAGRRGGAQPAAGVRRGRRADHHHPPQQGPGVPDRLRAVRLGPQRPRPGRAAAARRARPAGARRRRRDRRGLEGALRAAPGRGGRGGPAAALRGADPGPVPGGPLVGAGDHRGHLAGAPAAAGPSTGRAAAGIAAPAGSGGRCSSPPSGTGCRRTRRPRPRCAPGPGPRSPSSRWARPCRSRRQQPGRRRGSRCRCGPPGSPGCSTPGGGARRTPR